jgi:TonB family protein
VPLARLAKDQILKVDGPYYPATALAQHQEGACGLRVRVEADGTVKRVSLTRTSASVDLDTACKEAIYAAKFIPAEDGGAPVASSIDVWLAWHLPK